MQQDTSNFQYKWPLILAIVLHIVVLGALFFKFALPSVSQLGWDKPVNIVQASIVSKQPVKKTVAHAQPPKPVPEVAPTPPMPEKIEQPKPKPEPQVAAAAPTPTPAPVLPKQPDAKQLAQQKAAAEAKAKQAAELKQKQALAEKQRKAEQAKKLAAKQLQDAQQKLISQQLAQEQQSISNAAATAAANAAHDQKIQDELDKYKALVVQTISQNWLIPESADKSMSCQLVIKVGPGGSVLDVQIARSSGDTALDRSALTAVLKSSPLPVPDNPELFDKFRELRLTVRPENIVGG